VNLCARPLDPLDVEALASGAAPVHSADAREHSLACSPCSERISAAAAFAGELDGLGGFPAEGPAVALENGPDFAGRVLRLRPFSRRERRDFALWRGPCLLAAALFVSGLIALALPGISARDQAGLAAAALAPLGALVRAWVRWLVDVAVASPTALEALGQAMRREQAIGFACLLLLAPVVWGFRRAFARERRR
jgi:hypothetical protein